MNQQATLIGNLSKKSNKERKSLPISSENDPLRRKAEQLEKEVEKLIGKNKHLESENKRLSIELTRFENAESPDSSLLKKIEGLEKKLSKKEDMAVAPLVSNDLSIVYKNKVLQKQSTRNLMVAIENEIELQKTDCVTITRKSLIDKYNVNTAFITEAIEALASNGFIKVIKLSERKRTFSKLKDLPVT